MSGVWIYRLDSCSEGPPRNDRARCHTWLQSDRVREQPQVSQADSLLPPCPCNTVQVAMDTNFVQSRTESNCYFFHPQPVNTNYTRVGVQYKQYRLMIKSLGTAKNQWSACLNIFYLNCAFYSMLFSKWIWILYFPVFMGNLERYDLLFLTEMLLLLLRFSAICLLGGWVCVPEQSPGPPCCCHTGVWHSPLHLVLCQGPHVWAVLHPATLRQLLHLQPCLHR